MKAAVGDKLAQKEVSSAPCLVVSQRVFRPGPTAPLLPRFSHEGEAGVTGRRSRSHCVTPPPPPPPDDEVAPGAKNRVAGAKGKVVENEEGRRARGAGLTNSLNFESANKQLHSVRNIINWCTLILANPMPQVGSRRRCDDR